MTSRPRLSIERTGRWRRRLALVVTGLLTVGLLAWSGSWAAPAQPWRVGTDPTFPPFELRDSSSGRITGFDVDLIEAIGRQAGHPITLVPLPFDGIIPALQAHSIDAAISAITITAARNRSIAFSRPYFRASEVIVVRRDGPGYSSLAQLRGRRLAVQIGTTGALAAGRVPGAQVSSFDATPLALQELVNGNVDAVVSDEPAILYAIRDAKLTGLRISGAPLSTEFYGIALPTGSRLQAPINRALGQLIDSGRYAGIHRRWFGGAPPRLPAVAPALQQRSAASAGLDLSQLALNLLRGAGITLLLTVLSFSFGLLGGAALALLLQTPWPLLRRLCRLSIDFLRGTPLLVQLFLIYFGLPALLQSLGLSVTLDRMLAAVTALSLNVAAYLAETLRSGLEAVPSGQWEAAAALGIRPVARMRFVVAPQAIRRVLPSLANEAITLIKDTSLAAVIGFDELFRQNCSGRGS